MLPFPLLKVSIQYKIGKVIFNILIDSEVEENRYKILIYPLISKEYTALRYCEEYNFQNNMHCSDRQ